MKILLLSITLVLLSVCSKGQCYVPMIWGHPPVPVTQTTTFVDSTPGGNWSVADPAIATVGVTSGVVTGLSVGTTVITYTLSGACSGSYRTVTVQIVAGFIGRTKLCLGDTTTLQNVLTGPGTWTTSNPAVASVNGSTGFVTALSVGYTIVNHNFTVSGTAYSATDTVRVASVSSVGSITGGTSVCNGSNTTLSTSASVTWLSTNPSVANIVGINPNTVWGYSNSAGTTRIKITSEYCQSFCDSITFTVNPLPSAGTISGITTICPGNSETLTNASATGTSGYWSTSDPIVATINSSTGHLRAMVWAGGNVTITYTSINSFGCSAMTAINIFIMYPAFVSPITGPISLHIGDSAVYTSSWGSGSGGPWAISSATLATISPLSISSPPSSSVALKGLSLGTVTISFSASNMCSGRTEIKNVTIIPPSIGAISTGFTAFINRRCASPQFGVSVPAHASTYLLKTNYGDGNVDSTIISSSSTPALTTFTHFYGTSGTYTIKQVLFDGVIALDSVIYSYQHLLCRDMHLSFYVDDNDNCFYDSSTEHLNYFPLRVQVDSNGIAKDTISTTSGLYYQTWGNSGDIYTFHAFGVDSPLHFSCPVSGNLYDSLVNGGIGTGDKSIALKCTSVAGFDLSQNTNLIAGRHMAYGNIFFRNSTCAPQNPVVTLNVSPKYIFQYSFPSPSSIAGNTVTWNFSGVSASSNPPTIHYVLVIPTSTWLIPGDTVQNTISISPISGDANPANNVIFRVDTVKSSYDPNHISVSPEGNILNGTKLHYAIEFENDGNDTAQNIYVMDTLSDYLNLSTFRIEGASAAMNIAVLHSGGHNILKFEFPNIKLLDSTHHGRCTGTVFYNINAESGLADGTLIYAHAGIYFDDNPVVLTDSTINTILIPNISVATTTGDSICTGESVHLNAVARFVNTPHYHWYINSGSAGTDSSSLTIAGAHVGDTVKCILTTIMDDTVRSTSNSIVLINRGLPNAGSISGLSIVCAGANITLSETVNTGIWSSGSTAATVSAGVVSGLSAGAASISYSVTDLCGTSVASHSVTVNPLPLAGTVSGAASVCTGSSITLSGSSPGGSWTLTNGHAVNAGPVITGFSAGADTVVYTLTNSCGVDATHYPLTINPIVVPSIATSVTPGDTLCGGDSVTFTTVSVNGGPAPVYQWLKYSSVVGTGPTFSYAPANGDIIKCVMVSNAICPSPDTVTSIPTTFTVNSVVTPSDVISSGIGDSVTYSGQIVTINSTVSYCGASATFQWYRNGVSIPGATNTWYSAPVFTNDTFYCINYCNTPCASRLTDTSNTLIIYADYLAGTGVRNVHSTFSGISLFPNPNDGSFVIGGTVLPASNSPVQYGILDITGKVILTGSCMPVNGVVRESVSLKGECVSVAPGQYLLRVVTDGNVAYIQFTVVR